MFAFIVCILDNVAGLPPHRVPTAGMSLAQVQNCAKTSTELFFLIKYSQGYFQMIFGEFA